MPQKPTSLPGLGSLERGQETPDHEEVIGSYLDRLTLADMLPAMLEQGMGPHLAPGGGSSREQHARLDPRNLNRTPGTYFEVPLQAPGVFKGPPTRVAFFPWDIFDTPGNEGVLKRELEDGSLTAEDIRQMAEDWQEDPGYRALYERAYDPERLRPVVGARPTPGARSVFDPEPEGLGFPTQAADFAGGAAKMLGGELAGLAWEVNRWQVAQPDIRADVESAYNLRFRGQERRALGGLLPIELDNPSPFQMETRLRAAEALRSSVGGELDPDHVASLFYNWGGQLPLLGPYFAQMGEDWQEGRYGHSLGLLAGMFPGTAMKGVGIASAGIFGGSRIMSNLLNGARNMRWPFTDIDSGLRMMAPGMSSVTDVAEAGSGPGIMGWRRLRTLVPGWAGGQRDPRNVWLGHPSTPVPETGLPNLIPAGEAAGSRSWVPPWARTVAGSVIPNLIPAAQRYANLKASQRVAADKLFKGTMERLGTFTGDFFEANRRLTKAFESGLREFRGQSGEMLQQFMDTLPSFNALENLTVPDLVSTILRPSTLTHTETYRNVGQAVGTGLKKLKGIQDETWNTFRRAVEPLRAQGLFDITWSQVRLLQQSMGASGVVDDISPTVTVAQRLLRKGGLDGLKATDSKLKEIVKRLSNPSGRGGGVGTIAGGERPVGQVYLDATRQEVMGAVKGIEGVGQAPGGALTFDDLRAVYAEIEHLSDTMDSQNLKVAARLRDAIGEEISAILNSVPAGKENLLRLYDAALEASRAYYATRGSPMVAKFAARLNNKHELKNADDLYTGFVADFFRGAEEGFDVTEEALTTFNDLIGDAAYRELGARAVTDLLSGAKSSDDAIAMLSRTNVLERVGKAIGGADAARLQEQLTSRSVLEELRVLSADPENAPKAIAAFLGNESAFNRVARAIGPEEAEALRSTAKTVLNTADDVEGFTSRKLIEKIEKSINKTASGYTQFLEDVMNPDVSIEDVKALKQILGPEKYREMGLSVIADQAKEVQKLVGKSSIVSRYKGMVGERGWQHVGLGDLLRSSQADPEWGVTLQKWLSNEKTFLKIEALIGKADANLVRETVDVVANVTKMPPKHYQLFVTALNAAIVVAPLTGGAAGVAGAAAGVVATRLFLNAIIRSPKTRGVVKETYGRLPAAIAAAEGGNKSALQDIALRIVTVMGQELEEMRHENVYPFGTREEGAGEHFETRHPDFPYPRPQQSWDPSVNKETLALMLGSSYGKGLSPPLQPGDLGWRRER